MAMEKPNGKSARMGMSAYHTVEITHEGETLLLRLSQSMPSAATTNIMIAMNNKQHNKRHGGQHHDDHHHHPPPWPSQAAAASPQHHHRDGAEMNAYEIHRLQWEGIAIEVRNDPD
jgi:hypothetical protein